MKTVEDWVKIFSSTIPNQAEIIKGMLLEHEIESVILNKQDSSYLSFGDIEMYVHPDDVASANQLIEQLSNEDE